jgi:phosphoglycolate phosphatase
VAAASPLAGAVIAFDLDGTLVDTAPDLIGTLNVLLAQEGLAPLPLAEARPFIGRGARWMIERGFLAAGAHLTAPRHDALFQRFLVHYEAHIADRSRPFPGCVDALEALKAEGARLAVCTNKLTGLSKALLDAIDLTRLFDAVIGADAAPGIKPDPRHLLTAIAAAMCP